MKILVPAKRVVDHAVRITLRPDGSGVETDNVKMSLNPFDENAIEEALKLREAGVADEVVLVSIGPARCEENLRSGLAMGADRAILVETDTFPEPLAVAKILAAIFREEKADLVLAGKQAIDDDCNQTGQMLAALLGVGQATNASRIDISGQTATVTREVDGGLQTLALQLPAVVTCDLRLNTPRYASLPNIMKAKKKPLQKRPAGDFGVDLTPRLRVLDVGPPPQREGGVMVASVAELVDKLRNEAKII
ncbi:MAG TPA: electron transfer flavoprotein subunit beta/FixA family protein [Devosia sp.]|nr:electron transfer flavoprotein subunit beta/FixA family protein [Devosia sp.]